MEIEQYIKRNETWSKLPLNIKQALGGVEREYEKLVVAYSFRNQVNYKKNLVQNYIKDKKSYYEQLLRYCREHLMLFPYHLSEAMIRGLRQSPFAYYTDMLCDLMSHERSYDSLPNFTAADAVRHLGVGRNQYIDILNRCKTTRKFFKKRASPRECIADEQVKVASTAYNIEPWHIAQLAFVTELEANELKASEKLILDQLIDDGPQLAASLDRDSFFELFRRGFVYVDVPVGEDDRFSVPPLEGFIMNTVSGDPLETLLYKVFVSLDAQTSVGELANVLACDAQSVQNAVALLVRLGFARRVAPAFDASQLIHSSWQTVSFPNSISHSNGSSTSVNTADADLGAQKSSADLLDEADSGTTVRITDADDDLTPATTVPNANIRAETESVKGSTKTSNRVAVLYDSTLTAYLMMGNLSPGLKKHAVTMFEVGKLTDESLDSLVDELEKVSDEIVEGEVSHYVEHATALRTALKYLRGLDELADVSSDVANGNSTNKLKLDLVRCESLNALDVQTCARLLARNYAVLFSIAPIGVDARPLETCAPTHVGPLCAEMNSFWFRLFVAARLEHGPETLVFRKAVVIRRLPVAFRKFSQLLVTGYAHEPTLVASSSALSLLNEVVQLGPVVVQAFDAYVGWSDADAERERWTVERLFIPFPLSAEEIEQVSALDGAPSFKKVLATLLGEFALRFASGYVTVLCYSKAPSNGSDVAHDDAGDSGDSTRLLHATPSRVVTAVEFATSFLKQSQPGASCVSRYVIADLRYGLPLFDTQLTKAVLDRVSQCKLLDLVRTADAKREYRKLVLRLLSFVDDLQATRTASLPLTQQANPPADKLAEKLSVRGVRLPNHNILFADGKLARF